MIHDTIKQRLRASLFLVPSPKSIQALARHHAANLQADGTWNDLPAPDSPLPATGQPPHLARTLLLAKAHRAAAGALDDALRRALDCWLANDFPSPHWRDQQIAIPRLVGEIALLYDNGISPGAAGKVTEILARSRWANWVPPTGWLEHVGMDLLDVAYNHLLRGCLENASAFFDQAFGRIFREIRQARPGEAGLQADMTFHTPGSQNAGSGFAFMRACAQLIALAHGTPWQASAETVKLFVGFLLDGQQWMLRPGLIDAEATGDVLPESGDLDGMATAVQQLAQLGNPPRRSELAAFAHRLQGGGEALSGHRYFWRAWLSVHQRPTFYTSLQLAPPRPDGVNGALAVCADGQLAILRSGREYRGLAIPATGEPAPGTTTFFSAKGLPGENMPRPDAGPPRWLSGGVSEGDCGLAVTELLRPGLSGKKAWFFFDESLVCLGTGLSSTLVDHPVRTTINLARLQGPVAAWTARGERHLLSPARGQALSGVRLVEHDGISYVFPASADVSVHFDDPEKSPPADPAGAATAFRLQIDHGTRLQGEAYTYFVLPGGDDPGTPVRVADEVGCIEVLANSPALQAVRHRGSHLLGVAFWQPGVVPLPGGGRVAANHPCLLLCRAVPGGARLSISNLTPAAAAVHVEYGGQCVCLELAGGPDAGRSMSRLL